MDQWLASVIVALITAAASILGAWFQAGRVAKKIIDEKDVEMEHRVSFLEATQSHIKENMFSNDDRKCLQEVKTQIRFLLDYYVKEAASALKNPPQLRVALNAMELTGFSALKDLSISDKEDLKEYLDQQLHASDGNKRQHARMLLGLLKLEESESCSQV